MGNSGAPLDDHAPGVRTVPIKAWCSAYAERVVGRMTSNDLQRGTSGGSPQDPEEYADAILRTTSQPFLTLDGALIVQRAIRLDGTLLAALMGLSRRPRSRAIC